MIMMLLLNGSKRICYNLIMNTIDLKPYLNKFITVTLDDGKEESGFISNPEQFKETTDPDSILVLLNGLMNAEVQISRIVAVRESVREDTVKVPVVGYDEPLVDVNALIKEDEEESRAIRELLNDENAVPGQDTVDAAINELFEQSFTDTMDTVDVTSLLPAQEEDETEKIDKQN